MTTPRRASLLVPLLLAAASTFALSIRPAGTASADGATGAAALVEKEFANAIRTVTPATVFLVPKGVNLGDGAGSSGVLITRSGYVLSDGDPGFVGMKDRVKQYADVIEVRVPDPKKNRFDVYTSKVVRRIEGIDSCLLKIDTPPPSGFAFVVPRTADELRVGSFTFAMGTPFGHDEGGSASLTAGVVSALVRLPPGDPAGKNAELYTSAAVNPGVNGGPLVDSEGALVGIISTWGMPEAKNPFQFLGKAYPIDRIRAAYKDLPEFASIFPDPKSIPARSKQSDLLETAFSYAAGKAEPSVVSLEIARKNPFFMEIPTQGGNVRLPRYAGPVSGVVASPDGWIVTSLYNLGNTTFLAHGLGPDNLEKTLAEITGVTAYLPGGKVLPAKLVAYDLRLGIAALKVDLEKDYAATPVEAAPADSARVGRLLVCVGNPYGATADREPLVTVGMCSRIHPLDSESAWRGNFQTDAGVTDANCGGAMVDLHGRILGLATLWDPATQGRSSGIGFGIPWTRVLESLPSLQQSKSVHAGFLGVQWGQTSDDSIPAIQGVVADSAAAKAGLSKGDVLTGIDGKPLKSFTDVRAALRRRFEGDRVRLTLTRAGESVDAEVVLGARPADE